MSFVYFLVLVGALVSVHELGHFFAAKALDIKVLRFSLGFGPAIARARWRDTEYQIGVVPLGGYVRMLGEDAGDDVPEEDRSRSFHAKPLWRRLAVVLAGPLANLLCPVLVYFTLFARHTELPAAVVGDILADGPAAGADIQPGDRILEVNGSPVRYWEELDRMVDAHAGQVLRIKVSRDGGEFFTYVTPRRDTFRTRDGFTTQQGIVGITHAPFQPQVGVLEVDSPAGRAGLRTGDLVVSVDGESIASWSELERALARRGRRASLAYLRPHPTPVSFADIRLLEPSFADLVPEVVIGDDGARRVETGLFSAEFFVARVEAASPAEGAGLRAGDVIATLDGRPVTHWVVFDQALQQAPDREFQLGWLRAVPGEGVRPMSATVKQERRRVVDEFGHPHEVLLFGASNDFRPGPGRMVPIEGRFVYAASHAVRRTGTMCLEMVRGFGRLLTGDVPREVGGPITMYRIASVSGAKGWDSFLMMLALVSINLGLINLLPIPLLDGGQLVLSAVEGLRRRRLSPRVREAVVVAGLVLIISMTVLALRNDVVRYLLHGGN